MYYKCLLSANLFGGVYRQRVNTHPHPTPKRANLARLLRFGVWVRVDVGRLAGVPHQIKCLEIVLPVTREYDEHFAIHFNWLPYRMIKLASFGGNYYIYRMGLA